MQFPCQSSQFSFHLSGKSFHSADPGDWIPGLGLFQKAFQSLIILQPLVTIQGFCGSVAMIPAGTHIHTANLVAQDLQITAALGLAICKSQSFRNICLEGRGVIHLVIQAASKTSPIHFHHILVAIQFPVKLGISLPQKSCAVLALFLTMDDQ